MKIKTILGILSLAACTHLGAQTAQMGQSSHTDSLIVLSERDLVEGIKQIVASTQQSQGSSDLMQLLKYQLVLTAIQGGHGQVVPAHTYEPARCNACPSHTPSHGGGVTVINSGAKADPRIAELEGQIAQLRHQSREAKADPRLSEIDRKIDELLTLRKDLTALQSSLRAPEPAAVHTERIIMQPERVVDTVVLEPIGFKRQVFFAQGSAKLTSAARKTLAEVIDIMAKDHSLVLRLTGFASPEGNASLNQRLSDERSRAVQNHLVLSGISAQRLEPHAAGVDGQQELVTVARRVDIELARRVRAK